MCSGHRRPGGAAPGRRTVSETDRGKAAHASRAPRPRHIPIPVQLRSPMEEIMRLGKCSCAKVSALSLLPLLAAAFIGCEAAALPDQGATDNTAPAPLVAL